MVYFLAPFNLRINTTSRNRILSFYQAIIKNKIPVTLLNPPLIAREREVFLNGMVKSNSHSNDENIINLELKTGATEKLIDLISNKKYKKHLFALVNFAHHITKGLDLHYPSKSLLSYFSNQNSSSKDILIASAPPYSLLVTASLLADKLKCKLVLDYRDPWSYGFKPIDSKPIIGDIKKYLWRKREKECLKKATLILCESAAAKLLFPIQYHNKIHVIENGANLQAINPSSIEDRSDIFRIVYLGTVYNDQLIDKTFFSVLRDFISQYKIKDKLQLIFIGAAKNQTLQDTIKQYGLEKITTITERLPVEEAMHICYSATIFLHLKYGSRNKVDTSKHLDYMALQKPILLPISDNGNIAEKILKNAAGYVCENYQECFTLFEDLWKKHNARACFRIVRDDSFLYSISRESEAEKLVELLQKLQ